MTATMAATAILNSNRIEMYMVTAMKKTIRASMALSVTWPPQVGPTSLTFTSFGVVWAALARASWTLFSMLVARSTG